VRRRRLPVVYRAQYGRGWTARFATAGLIRALRAVTLEDSRQADEIYGLLRVMQSARDERASAMARAAVEEAWAKPHRRGLATGVEPSSCRTADAHGPSVHQAAGRELSARLGPRTMRS
jgi:hypothetical protein